MDNVLALLKKRGEILHIFGYIHLRSLGRRAFAHFVVKHIKGNGLAQIVRIVLTVQVEVEADVMYVPTLKMLLAQVRSRAAAQNIIAHFFIPFAVEISPRRASLGYRRFFHFSSYWPLFSLYTESRGA